MSNTFRPEIALSVYLNEQLLGVLPLPLPQDPQLVTEDGLPLASNANPSMEIPGHGGSPIPLSVHLVGDQAACEALRLMAMKKLAVTINILAKSGFDLGRTFAFNGQTIKHVGTSSTDPNHSFSRFTYTSDDNGIPIDQLTTTTTYEWTPPPESPVDPPTVVE